MTITRDELYERIQTFAPEHFFRRFAEASDYPPGHLYLACLGHALNSIQSGLSSLAFKKTLEERLRAGPKHFINTQLYDALSKLTVLCWLTELGHDLKYEPVLRGGGRNPDVLWMSVPFEVEIEVKCPDLFPTTLQKYDLFGSNQPIISEHRFRSLGGVPAGVEILPQDNKVKDFLISANNQFTPRETRQTDRYSLLCIAWSHEEKEALAYLLGLSGLLTSRTFHCDAAGEPITHSNIDAVLVTDIQGAHNDWFSREGTFANPFMLASSRRYLVQNPGSPMILPNELIASLQCEVVDEHWVDSSVAQIISWPLRLGRT